MEIVLRPATGADIPALTDLWAAAWRGVMPGIDFEARRPWFDGRIREHLAGGVDVVLATEASGSILGFVTVDVRNGHIDQLGVARDSWGRGIARTLLAQARLLSPAGLNLEVNVGNERAVRFYEREGFQRVGEGVSAASGLPLWVYRWTPGGAADARST